MHTSPDIAIDKSTPEIHSQLVDIWLRSVRATHEFLSDEDIKTYLPVVRDEAFRAVDLWVAFDEKRRPLGFLGLSGTKIAMLFLDPDHIGLGIGRRFLDHAATLHSNLQVDVNESNAQAHAFYRRWGFEQVGRSELDEWGKPFPILHLAWRGGRAI